MKKLLFHHNERGSAILITLGILTLVLTLALVFVATSRNARAIATAGADYEKAGLVAESAAARAQAVSYYTQSVLIDNIPLDSSVSDLTYDHQPYAGSFMVNDALTHAPSAAGGTEQYRQVRVQHLKGKNSGGAADTTQNGYVLYTHDKNNKNGAEHLVYNFMASTNYGKYLSVSTANFQNSLGRNNYNSNFTYQNILDADGHVQSRYAFLMIPEGPKFNVNRMVLAGGDGVNNIPFVQGGELAKPADFDPNDFTGVGSLQDDGHSYFAITGYEYNDSTAPGKITGLKNSGAYDEGDTLQYGLHPQELRISDKVKDLADNLELNDDDKPPQWFNYDNLLANNKGLWDSGTDLRYFWSLYTIESGLDDREVLYHGNEADIEECSNNSPKINLAYPMQTSWDTISNQLSSALAGGTSVSDLLSSNFQDILGDALDSDTESHVLFKDDSGSDITSQVFANLVDFCDSDDAITYEATVGTSSARLAFDTPKSTFSSLDPSNSTFSNQIQVVSSGNEKTPAIIGVGLELTGLDWKSNKISNNNWQISGTGAMSCHVRVVLQNYFNDPVDLPEKVRMVIRGKINPWFAGRYRPNSSTPYTYHFFSCKQATNMGNNDYNSFLNGMDFSLDAVPFVIDTENAANYTGTLVERGVDDTTIDINVPAADIDCGSFTLPNGPYTTTIERCGLWLQVTDILVMTADDSGNVKDIAFVNDGNGHNIPWRRNSAANLDFTEATGYRPIVWAVAQDPRCNHKDWKWFDVLHAERIGSLYPYRWGWGTDTIGLAKYGTGLFGMQDNIRRVALTLIQNTCKNGIFATSSSPSSRTYVTKDLEPDLDLTTDTTGTDVVQTRNTFSTAFIPNAPITSLWQLGAVSRGAIAQTINLKKYGGPKGGQKYEDGDAWLLDYFKLNELKADSSFPGKFNPNCFYARAYRYLLANIPANPDPNDTAVYQPGRLSMSDIKHNKFYYDMIKQEGTPIELEHPISGVHAPDYWDTNDYHAPSSPSGLFVLNPLLNFEVNGNDENLSPQQAPKQSWSPVEAFFNFVVILNIPKYKESGSTKNANDRMVESLIGCTAGLLSTRYEYFTVFAVGQSLKYLGQTHTSGRDDYIAGNPFNNAAFKAQLINPVQINAKTGSTAAAQERGWYSVLATQMRLMTIERDCWFNTMRVVHTQLY